MKKGIDGVTIGANISELMTIGHAAEQAVAIAHSFAQTPDKAAGILYHCAGNVLLLLRAGAAENHPLTWAFPGGGIDPGETPEQAAIRESMEETGYTPTDPLRFLDWCNGFTTYFVELAEPFVPVLNNEHLGYAWVPLASLPQPMHPGCALTLGRVRLPAGAAVGMDERVVDGNGWFEVKANPISKAGVFPYSGRQLGLTGPDADRIFQVLRPPEELADPKCIESFKLIPWIDEHVMLGPNAQAVTDRAMPAEKKGVQGVIGEDVFFKDGTLFANLKAFSSTLAALIKAGKRELSAGYRCIYDMTAGVWNGQSYDAVQREIRGNHLALVTEGRMGPDVAVMDRLTFSFDAMEATMAGETEGGGAGAMTLEEAVAMLSSLAPQVQKLQAAFAALAPSAPAAVEAEVDAAPAAADKDPAPAAAGGEGGEGTPAGTVAADKDPAPDAATMDAAEIERGVITRLAKRDALARALSVHVGTFDHSDKTLEQVVAYGCEKLGIKAEKGTEVATLAGFLQAKPAGTPPATATGMDAAPKAGSFVTKHLKGE